MLDTSINASLLPITVFATILLFITKEIVDVLKTLKADRLRISLIKNLLAVGIEDNTGVLREVKRLAVIHDENYSFRIGESTFPKGITVEEKCGTQWALWLVVRQLDTTIFKKVLFELPILDKGLFEAAKKAYQGIAEVQHIQNSWLRYIHEDNYRGPEYEGFTSYATRELDIAYMNLSDLYKKCTHKDLNSLMFERSYL